LKAKIRAGLVASLPADIVDELLAAHSDAKQEFYMGGLRLSAVEGGRFCEAAFRLLEHIITGTHTPLGTPLNTDGIIRQLAGTPTANFSSSVRLHIPRGLRVVYDIRNKRDAAHLSDGIDPNLQDAVVVVGIIDWVMAEFVRLFHNVNANEASQIVDAIVTRRAPVVQDFDGFLKVLNPTLAASEHILVLLYHRGGAGASYQELAEWVRPSMRKNLRRTLTRLAIERDLIHENQDVFNITRLGEQEIEQNHLLEPLPGE